MTTLMKTFGLALLLAASTASAQGGGIKGDGRYGTAGCGLGSLAFGDQQGPIQIIAATLNGTGIQTFGITTGTSNCGPGMFAEGTKNFVEANREALAKDVSRGTGDAIGAVAVINACRDPRAVGAALQKNYKAIFPSETATSDEITAELLKTLHTDKSLGCGGA
jgi:hypothetical protein